MRVLLVYPRFARNNFLNWEYMIPFYPGKKAVLPPLGLLIIASRFAQDFEVRMIDENVEPLLEEHLLWADAVALSGMHPQRRRMSEILEWANRLGRITIAGGPSVNVCPEFYPMADAIHVGEMGDATEALVEWLRGAPKKPNQQIIFATHEKLSLDNQPLPDLSVIDVNHYMVLPIQFSVGCPFTCEFCDIPVIYGRIARLKSPERLVRELQAIYDTGFIGTILFVDDNLIANRKALRAMLPEVAAWQQRTGHPYPLTGEASVNLARDEEILRLLHAARFTHMFIGVETPDPETLRDISKKQNVMDPLIESIRTLGDHGLEVIMGMILGFDSDTERSGEVMAEFIAETNAPIIYFNLLAALPKTPLWDRMVLERRLRDESGDALQSEDLLSCLTSNIQFKLDNEVVKQMLLATVREVYSPYAVFRRLRWTCENVYGQQIQGMPPTRTWQERMFAVRFAAGTLARVLRDIGARAEYRTNFWCYVRHLMKLRREGRIASVLEVLLRTAPNAHHLITWGRELIKGDADRRMSTLAQSPLQMPDTPEIPRHTPEHWRAADSPH